MALTKQEQTVIRNLIRRLKAPNCGCSHITAQSDEIADLNARGLEVPSRIYLDSWVIPGLEMLLPESRNVDLAERLTGRG